MDQDYELQLALQESLNYNNYDDDILRALEESKLMYNNNIKIKTRTNVNTIVNKNNKTNDETLFAIGFNKLNDFQKDIFYECINKKSMGLSLPLGSGKTLISIVIGLYFIISHTNPAMIVTSKSLVTNWEFEINKFFGGQLKYEIVHQNVAQLDVNLWKIKPTTKFVLITIDLLAAFYRQHSVEDLFIKKIYDKKHRTFINNYISPTKPLLNHILGGGYFYSVNWSSLIVDEIQKYTNIDTFLCKSLATICSDNKWLLSGTLFEEPSINRVMGFIKILQISDTPKTLPDMDKHVKSQQFNGLQEYIISRANNNAFVPPKVNEYIITHKLFKEEEQIYTMMRKILVEIKNKAYKAKLYNNITELKLFNSYKLVMIMYLRQALVCPLLPITSVSLNTTNMRHKSELSKLIINELNNNGLNKWMDNVESVRSSRIMGIIENTNKHLGEKIIIFACFKSFLDILHYYLLEINRPLFMMTSIMSIKKRQMLLNSFEKSNNGILLVSYQLGAEGLNLQFVSTIMLVDFWWNSSKIQQAIGRIFRYGQMSKEINVYFFTSNTGIEKMLFQKQKAKIDILNELMCGNQKTAIPIINIDDIIKMIEIADNQKLLKNIKYY